MVKNAVVFQIFAVSSVQNGWSKNAVAKEKSAQVFLGGGKTVKVKTKTLKRKKMCSHPFFSDPFFP